MRLVEPEAEHDSAAGRQVLGQALRRYHRRAEDRVTLAAASTDDGEAQRLAGCSGLEVAFCLAGDAAASCRHLLAELEHPLEALVGVQDADGGVKREAVGEAGIGRIVSVLCHTIRGGSSAGPRSGRSRVRYGHARDPEVARDATARLRRRHHHRSGLGSALPPHLSRRIIHSDRCGRRPRWKAGRLHAAVMPCIMRRPRQGDSGP